MTLHDSFFTTARFKYRRDLLFSDEFGVFIIVLFFQIVKLMSCAPHTKKRLESLIFLRSCAFPWVFLVGIKNAYISEIPYYTKFLRHLYFEILRHACLATLKFCDLARILYFDRTIISNLSLCSGTP